MSIKWIKQAYEPFDRLHQMPVDRRQGTRTGGAMKGLLWILASVFLLGPLQVHAQSDPRFFGTFQPETQRVFVPRPSDPRFFGTYCNPEPIRLCDDVPGFFGLFQVCGTLENVRAHFKYVDTPGGGLVGGGGPFTWEGTQSAFVMGGRVSAPGVLSGHGTAWGYGKYRGKVELSSDGLELSIKVKGETIRLRKDACGNNPPGVTIIKPDDGRILTFGKYFPFTAIINDEDETFPPERTVFKSNRDGVLVGPTFVGPSTGEFILYTNSLSPGNHTITFTATDSGGLSASTTVNVSVTNVPPGRPDVLAYPKDEGGGPGRVVAGGAVVLEGKAFDLEDRVLKGEALVWRASVNGGRPKILGYGERLGTRFEDPGDVVLTLTAVDSTGDETTSVERRITVEPFTGNTHPRVTIEVPDPHLTRGAIAAVFSPGAIDFLGTAEDTEDPTTDLELRWHFEAIRPAGTPTPDDVSGTPVTKVSITPAVDTFYRVTFSAEDTRGLVGQTSINILVLAQPID